MSSPFFRNWVPARIGGVNVQTLVATEFEDIVVVDPVEEMKLRTWARRHYAPAADRDSGWHPIVLDEMARRDREAGVTPRRPR